MAATCLLTPWAMVLNFKPTGIILWLALILTPLAFRHGQYNINALAT